MKNRIIVTRRISDYHACVDGQTGKWGCGETVEEAVEELFGAWRDEFVGETEIIFRYVPRALRASAEGRAT